MAIDYSGQGWYDDQLTWTENYNVFVNLQKDDGYTLGDFTGTEAGDIAMESDLKVKSNQETQKIADFYTAREAARTTLSSQQATDVDAFNTLWQAKEDNGYDVDYTP